MHALMHNFRSVTSRGCVATTGPVSEGCRPMPNCTCYVSKEMTFFIRMTPSTSASGASAATRCS